MRHHAGEPKELGDLFRVTKNRRTPALISTRPPRLGEHSAVITVQRPGGIIDRGSHMEDYTDVDLPRFRRASHTLCFRDGCLETMHASQAIDALQEAVMSASARRLSWFGGTVLGVSCVATVLAQGRSDGTDAAASLAPLTSELRQLRVAVEEWGRSQTQTQALGVYLSVQQSRILQLATRLDSARKDLETATIRSRDITWRLANANDELSQITEPERRRQLEDAIQQRKHELRMVALQEQEARTRETELSQALHLEESRWTDLISRLEQLTKR